MAGASARALKEAVGRYGIWSRHLRSEEPAVRAQVPAAAAELEALGFRAVWLGSSPGVRHAVPVVEATSVLTVATGILSIWQYEAAAVATECARLESAHPGRFLLGLGVSHAAIADRYRRPYSSMVSYLDDLDAAGQSPVHRVLAALGPRMLALSRERAAGAHPYLVTPEHTEQARGILGPDALLAPELKVVLSPDPARARTLARAALTSYLRLPNYLAGFRRLGFADEDFADGGSDRLVDAVVAWGPDERIRERIAAFHRAGADHVALQVVSSAPEPFPRAEWQHLAELLPLSG